MPCTCNLQMVSVTWRWWWWWWSKERSLPQLHIVSVMKPWDTMAVSLIPAEVADDGSYRWRWWWQWLLRKIWPGITDACHSCKLCRWWWRWWWWRLWWWRWWCWKWQTRDSSISVTPAKPAWAPSADQIPTLKPAVTSHIGTSCRREIDLQNIWSSQCFRLIPSRKFP